MFCVVFVVVASADIIHLGYDHRSEYVPLRELTPDLDCVVSYASVTRLTVWWAYGPRKDRAVWLVHLLLTSRKWRAWTEVRNCSGNTPMWMFITMNVMQSINQNYFIVRPKVDQRAGRFSLPQLKCRNNLRQQNRRPSCICTNGVCVTRIGVTYMTENDLLSVLATLATARAGQ